MSLAFRVGEQHLVWGVFWLQPEYSIGLGSMNLSGLPTTVMMNNGPGKRCKIMKSWTILLLCWTALVSNVICGSWINFFYLSRHIPIYQCILFTSEVIQSKIHCNQMQTNIKISLLNNIKTLTCPEGPSRGEEALKCRNVPKWAISKCVFLFMFISSH